MKSWLKFLCLLALCCAGASGARGQLSYYSSQATRYTPAGNFGAGGAFVSICTLPAAGAPCTPLATIFADAAASVPVSAAQLPQCTTPNQTGCIDNLGNYSFYAAPGLYAASFTGAGLRAQGPQVLVLPCFPGVTGCAGGGGGTFYQTVQANGASQTQQPILNLIPGTNMTSIACVNNGGATRTDCTFNAAGGGGGGGGINITVNGGSNIATPANFRNQTGGSGLQTLLSNPSASNIEVALTGSATKAQQYGAGATSNGTAYTDQVNIYGAFTQDMSAASGFRIPQVGAIGLPTLSSLWYSTVDGGLHMAGLTTDNFAPLFISGSSNAPNNTTTDGCPHTMTGGGVSLYASQCGTVNPQTGASYTVSTTGFGDRDKLITLNNAGAIALTGPLNSVRLRYDLFNIGAGTVTETPQGGALCNGSANCLIPPQWYALQWGAPTGAAGGLITPVLPSIGAFPNCLDSGGNHLNFTTSTGKLSCGSSVSNFGNIIYAANPAYGLVVDGHVTADASWTNTGAIVSAGQGFPGAVIGQVIWGMSTCQDGQVAVSPSITRTTITSVTDINHIGVAAGSMVAPGTAACITYGTNNDGAAAAVEAAYDADATCPFVYWPQGIMVIEQSHFTSQPASCTQLGAYIGQAPYAPGMVFGGQGIGTTIFMMSPAFDVQGTCTHGATGKACFGGVQAANWQNFTISGQNLATSNASTLHYLWEVGPYEALNYVQLQTFGSNDANLVGMYNRGFNLNAPNYMFHTICDAFGKLCYKQEAIVGQPQAYSTMSAFQDVQGLYQVDLEGGFWYSGGGNLFLGSPGSPVGSHYFRNNGATVWWGATDLCGLNLATNGNQICYENNAGTTNFSQSQAIIGHVAANNSVGLLLNAGTVYAANTTFTGDNPIFGTGGTFIDNCGNTFTGGSTSMIGVTVNGSCSITGTPATTGMVVLAAGWGTGRAVTSVTANSNSSRSQFLFTAGTSPSLNPNFTYTFPTPFLSVPFCKATEVTTNDIFADTETITGSSTLTACTFQWHATPTNLKTYTFLIEAGN